MTHSKPRQNDNLRAVGCVCCVSVEILIEIRLSRYEALGFINDCDGVSCKAPPLGKASAHAFSWAFIRDARLQWAQPCASSVAQRKGKTGSTNVCPSMDRCQPNLCGAEFPLETGLGKRDEEQPYASLTFSYQLAPCPITVDLVGKYSKTIQSSSPQNQPLFQRRQYYVRIHYWRNRKMDSTN